MVWGFLARHMDLYRDTLHVASEDGVNESYAVGPRKARLFGIPIPILVCDFILERLTK